MMLEHQSCKRRNRRTKRSLSQGEVNPLRALFGKWRIEVDGRGLKGILENFEL
jgi:hypothetical protein